jgi:hypothetical protein
VDHLSVFVWNIVKDGIGWSNIPKSVIDFHGNFLLERGQRRNNLLFLLVWCCLLDFTVD